MLTRARGADSAAGHPTNDTPLCRRTGTGPADPTERLGDGSGDQSGSDGDGLTETETAMADTETATEMCGDEMKTETEGTETIDGNGRNWWKRLMET